MTRSDVTATDQAGGPLKLEFPAQQGYLKVCRLTVSAIAAGAGFDVDELDDLRLAVTEAVTWLAEGDRPTDQVSLTVRLEDGLVVEGSRRCEDPLADEGNDLLDAILGATLDEFSLDSTGDRRTLRLVKRPMGV